MQVTLAFIGAGNMGEALLSGILRAGLLSPENIWATDVRPERVDYLKQTYRIQATADNIQAATQAGIIILAVKPQHIKSVAEQMKSAVQGKLLISIAAGVSLDTIGQYTPPGTHMIRVMPNLPATVGAGLSALSAGAGTTSDELQLAANLFNCVGETVLVEEKLLDAVTGLSGSGPGFVMVIAEALADAGVKAGLPRDVALKLSTQTLLGSAMLLKAKGLHPAQIKDMVTSPGGTTIAGIQALEEGGLRGTLMQAVGAAVKRAGELNTKG